MRLDDDSFFIIIILENNKPIYFNKTYDSEEMQGFASFMEMLKEKIGFEPIWKEDKIVLAFPENLRGKEIYKPWTSSINAFFHGIKRFFWLEHHASGIIKDEFKNELESPEKNLQ